MKEKITLSKAQKLASEILNFKKHDFFTKSNEEFLTVLIHYRNGDIKSIKREDIDVEKFIGMEQYKNILKPFIDVFEKEAFIQLKGMLSYVVYLLERTNEVDNDYLKSIGITSL